MSSDGWVQYAEYARRLDEVRSQESARTQGMREAVAEMTEHADQLEGRLHQQNLVLGTLAAMLRVRMPKLTPIPPQEPVEAATGLSTLAGVIDRADSEANQAAARGKRASLLPGLSGTARSVLVYGIAALAVLGLQALAFNRTGTETNPITVLFLIPLVGFVLAYLVLQVGGRTRVAGAGEALPTRLGFLMCFLVGPIGAAVTVALSFQSR